MIGPGAKIGAGARVRESVLLPGAEVPRWSRTAGRRDRRRRAPRWPVRRLRRAAGPPPRLRETRERSAGLLVSPTGRLHRCFREERWKASTGPSTTERPEHRAGVYGWAVIALGALVLIGLLGEELGPAPTTLASIVVLLAVIVVERPLRAGGERAARPQRALVPRRHGELARGDHLGRPGGADHLPEPGRGADVRLARPPRPSGARSRS